MFSCPRPEHHEASGSIATVARCGWRSRLRSASGRAWSNQLPGRHLEVADQVNVPCRSYSTSIRAGFPGSSASIGRSAPTPECPHLVDANGVGTSRSAPTPAPRGTCRRPSRPASGTAPVLLGGVQPIPALVGLQGGRAEEAAHLGRRDRRDDAPLDDLVGPVAGPSSGYGPAAHFSGGSQATARIWVTCSGVNLPGRPGRGASLRTAAMARRRSALVSRHSRAIRPDQARAQRRRHRPTWNRPRPT